MNGEEVPPLQLRTNRARDPADADSYDTYVRAEWTLFARNPARRIATRNAVAGVCVKRVLDIGCGAGQELRAFVDDGATLGVGVDVSPEVGLAGRRLFASEMPGSRVVFVRAAAERLPFAPASFDLLICRLALPYTDNRQAIREMARLLRPGGALLLTFHHARYYVGKLLDGLSTAQFRSAIHACRVLVAGVLYHLARSQPRGRLTGGETFQTLWLLRRELERQGLQLLRVLPGSLPEAPTVLIVPRDLSSGLLG